MAGLLLNGAAELQVSGQGRGGFGQRGRKVGDEAKSGLDLRQQGFGFFRGGVLGVESEFHEVHPRRYETTEHGKSMPTRAANLHAGRESSPDEFWKSRSGILPLIDGVKRQGCRFSFLRNRPAMGTTPRQVCATNKKPSPWKTMGREDSGNVLLSRNL